MKKRFGIKSALLVTLVVVAGVVAVLELTNTTHWFHTAKATDSSGINYGPPTQAEINDSESHKNTPANESDTTNSSSSKSPITKKKVSVEITTYNSSKVSVNGFVTGVVESGGTCTLTLTAQSDGKVVKGTHPGEANATNTTCGETIISVGSLHPGTWNAVLSYSSKTSAGTSDPTPLEIQK